MILILKYEVLGVADGLSFDIFCGFSCCGNSLFVESPIAGLFFTSLPFIIDLYQLANGLILGMLF